jgi:hypothetical protein
MRMRRRAQQMRDKHEREAREATERKEQIARDHAQR